MYTSSPPSELFGLREGQSRGESTIVHNCGWFNQTGEKLGSGNLAAQDFKRLAAELRTGEVFVILASGATFAIRNQAPSTEYVIEKCVLVVVKGHIYYVDRFKSFKGVSKTEVGRAFWCEVLAPDEVKTVIVR
jgi:hypothetical protein